MSDVDMPSVLCVGANIPNTTIHTHTHTHKHTHTEDRTLFSPDDGTSLLYKGSLVSITIALLQQSQGTPSPLCCKRESSDLENDSIERKGNIMEWEL